MTENTHPIEQIEPCPFCGRPVRAIGVPDFTDDDEVCTVHYEPVCESEKETWYLVEIGRLVKVIDSLQASVSANAETGSSGEITQGGEQSD